MRIGAASVFVFFISGKVRLPAANGPHRASPLESISRSLDTPHAYAARPWLAWPASPGLPAFLPPFESCKSTSDAPDLKRSLVLIGMNVHSRICRSFMIAFPSSISTLGRLGAAIGSGCGERCVVRSALIDQMQDVASERP